MAQNITNWQYWQCDLQTEAAAFGPYASIVALWKSRCPSPGALPPRFALDFVDFRDWLGRVAIARIGRDPVDVHFTLWGTTLSDWWGVDYTNRRLGEASANPDAWSETEGQYFARMACKPFIGIACGQLDQHDRSFKKVMGLDLPVGDGQRLTHVFALHMEIPLVQGPADILTDCPITAMAFD